MKLRFMAKYSVVLGLAAGLCGMGSAGAQTRSVLLTPHHDPWAKAVPRLWDIENRAYSAFISGNPAPFDYANAQVELTYDTNPSTRYFVGQIRATGLKPNFWYQMKLVGKPQRGPAGWGTSGDDTANENIGYAARWWCTTDGTTTNFDDNYFWNNYGSPALADSRRQDTYGYLYMAGFLTDEFGNAKTQMVDGVPVSVPVAFDGNKSYHVTWKRGQNGFFDVRIRETTLSSTSGYGYGSAITNAKPIELWYELERGYSSRGNQPRYPTDVRLRSGNYNCRFVLTEETFHNDPDYAPSYNGGRWTVVMATEDYAWSRNPDGSWVRGLPDSDPNNDVQFTIPGPVVPTQGSATAGNKKVVLTWGVANGATSYNVARATATSQYTTLRTGLTGTSYTDTSVANGTTYYYRIIAVNSFNQSGGSNVVAATPRLR
ncbi:MAG TPA: hypothetical protein VF600_12820 [Abditibacteriaceae bacterium]